MIKRIDFTGQLRTAADLSPRRRRLDLQAFLLDEGWVTIGAATTSAGGVFAGVAEVAALSEMRAAPTLRLVADAPLAMGLPTLAFAGDALSVNFGPVTLPPEGPAVTDRTIFLDRPGMIDLTAISSPMAVSAARIEGLTSEIGLRDTRLRELSGSLESMRATTAALESRNGALEAQLAGLTRGAAGRGVSDVADLPEAARTEITRLTAANLGKDVELTFRDERARTLEWQVAKLSTERDAARAELTQVRTGREAAPPIADLAGAIGGALDLGRQAGAFALADARISVKGYVLDGGTRFKPLDGSETATVSGGVASELTLGFRPRAPEAEQGDIMPDLLGLTPAGARRLVRPLGLRLDVVETAGQPDGAVIDQHPKAGEALPPGTASAMIVVATGEEGI